MQKRKVYSVNATDTVKQITSNIEDLPTEVLELILQLLSAHDLASCFNVCTKWRTLLNKNEVWQRHCIYDTKYYINLELSGTASCNDPKGICAWKRAFDKEQLLFENWTKGKFTTEEKMFNCAGCLTDFIDDKGHHWVFQFNSEIVNVWDITNAAKLHTSFNMGESFIGMCLSKDCIVLHRSDYIKVLHFEHPKYTLSPAYRFIFDGEHILTEDTVVSEDYYTSFSRHLIADKYFVGYYENIPDIKTCKFHVWDLCSAEKVAAPRIYQQSFVDFVRASSNADITEKFSGGLLIFGSEECTDILVAVIDDDHELCQVTLFSVENRRFLNIIVELKSKRVWCFMSNDIIAIHSLMVNHSQISVFYKSGEPLSSLKLPFSHNPATSNQFWLGGSKMFLSQTNSVIVVDMKTEQRVKTWHFEVYDNYKILGFYEPKFLLLFKKSTVGGDHGYVVSVWDICSKRLLYDLFDVNVECIGSLKSWFAYSKFPGKVVVPRSTDYASILEFCTNAN